MSVDDRRLLRRGLINVDKARRDFEAAIQLISSQDANMNDAHLAWAEDDFGDNFVIVSGRFTFVSSPNASEFEVVICPGGDPAFPGQITLSIMFPEPVPLPLSDTTRLYNVFACLSDRVALCLLPSAESESIRAMGVRYDLSVAIDVCEIRSALSDLEISRGLAWNWLAYGKGDDHWSGDGGCG